MKNRLESFKRIMFYAGLKKEDFDSFQDVYLEPNWMILNVMSLIVSVGTFIFSMLSIFDKSLMHNLIAYSSASIFSLLILVMNLNWGRDNIRLLEALSNMFLVITYCMGIMNGTITDPVHHAITFLVIIVAMPLMFNGRPILMLGEMVSASIIFIVMALMFKSPDVLMTDIINVVTFTTISFIMNLYLTKVKVKNYQAQADEMMENIILKEQLGILNREKSEGLLNYELMVTINKLYESIFRIDLVNDSCEEIMSEDGKYRMTSNQTIASETIVEFCRKADEEFADALRNFYDLSTLQYRLADRETTDRIYRAEDGQWYLAAFIAEKRDFAGKAIKVLLIMRPLTRQKVLGGMR